jgi:opacity protein-like surface antigen
MDMKKCLVLAMIFAVTSTAVFAQEGSGESGDKPKSSLPFGIKLSAGGGALFSADFTTYTMSGDYKDMWDYYAGLYPDSMPGYKADLYNQNTVVAGFYAFFDATYAEANVAMVFGRTLLDNTKDRTAGDNKPINISALRLGLLGKYPIPLNGKFTLFPMLGIDGEIVMSEKHDGKNTKITISKSKKDATGTDAHSSFWFKAGVGGDYALTETLYLRGEFLYGIRLNNKAEQWLLGDGGKTTGLNNKDIKQFSSIVGHGLDVKVGVGYKF